MTKYSVSDDHWDPAPDDSPPAWVERTSAQTEIEVTLHEQGYQQDRKWTVHVSADIDDPADAVRALWAAEHHNKGNFWREPQLWRDAVDFVDLPRPVRERVAAILGRSVSEVTPDKRVIRRADGTGVADEGATEDESN